MLKRSFKCTSCEIIWGKPVISFTYTIDNPWTHIDICSITVTVYIHTKPPMYRSWTSGPLKSNLRRAAKARIDRMCKPHAKRAWLNVPQWLHDEWKSGNKDVMADCLRDCNFDKDTILNILIWFVKNVWKANHMQQNILIIHVQRVLDNIQWSMGDSHTEFVSDNKIQV